MKSVTAIIQARMGSTRLPGKILKDLSGKPVLWHIHNRLSHSKKIDKIIIATTTLDEDNTVDKFCKENNFNYYRGSSEDVLSRYYEAAQNYKAETIIRITADCPLLDPELIDNMIETYNILRKKNKAVYLSNGLKRTFPRGLDAEIFDIYSLQVAYQNAKENFEREHVTPYIYRHPEIFSLHDFLNDEDFSFHRWTLDTEEDYLLIKKIYNHLYKPDHIFGWKEVLELFDQKPELFDINKNVKQKEV